MQKKTIIIIAGIVLAFVGVFMGKMYLDQERARIQEEYEKKVKKTQESQVEVLVAKTAIPEGATIEADDVDVKKASRNQVDTDEALSLNRVAGMTAVSSIAKGEVISLRKLAYQRSGDLAAATPPGKRAISINVDALSSLGGMIKPKDYVDVIAMIPMSVPGADGKAVTQLTVMPLFQNVLVLAVGSQTSGASAAERQARYRGEASTQKSEPAAGLITLALSPQEASFIAFIQEQAKIRLSLRSPVDAKIEPVMSANWQTLSQYLTPPEAREEQVKVKQEPEETVEIFRGLTKEEVPLK